MFLTSLVVPFLVGAIASWFLSRKLTRWWGKVISVLLGAGAAIIVSWALVYGVLVGSVSDAALGRAIGMPIWMGLFGGVAGIFAFPKV